MPSFMALAQVYSEYSEKEVHFMYHHFLSCEISSLMHREEQLEKGVTIYGGVFVD